MINVPEVLKVVDSYLQILNATSSLQNSTTKEAYSLAQQITPALRKMWLAAVMQDRKMICITGLQGTGKTTLMSKFYGLDGILTATRGRGEEIPVLITEKENLSEPELYEFRIAQDANGIYDLNQAKIDRSDYVAAAKGSDPNVLYLELNVPLRHTQNEAVSFLLLPGYERYNINAAKWNDLIEYSVNSSDAAIFVFNETSFAHLENWDMATKIQEQFGSHLVYAISGADQSADQNEAVKHTCMKMFDIPETEADRIVCTGAFENETDNNAWIEKFKEAIEKYADVRKDAKKQANQYIGNAAEEMLSLLGQISDILENFTEDVIIEHKNYALLKEYDRAVAKKRKELSRNLEAQFGIAKNKSIEKLEDQFDKAPKKGRIKQFFFGRSVKEQFTQTREFIELSLKDDDGHLYSDKALQEALQLTLNQWYSPEAAVLPRMLETTLKSGNTVLLDNKEESLVLKEDVCHLLAASSESSKCYALQCETPRKLMQVIAELSTLYFGQIAYDHTAEYIGMPYFELASWKIKPADILNGATETKKFAAGIAGVLGIDLLTDGAINLIPQIAASVGAAVPITAAVLAVISGAGAASVIMKDLNRMLRDDYLAARQTTNEIYDNIQREILTAFDNCTEMVRERMENNLDDLSKAGKDTINIYNARLACKHMFGQVGEIAQKARGDMYGNGGILQW